MGLLKKLIKPKKKMTRYEKHIREFRKYGTYILKDECKDPKAGEKLINAIGGDIRDLKHPILTAYAKKGILHPCTHSNMDTFEVKDELYSKVTVDSYKEGFLFPGKQFKSEENKKEFDDYTPILPEDTCENREKMRLLTKEVSAEDMYPRWEEMYNRACYISNFYHENPEAIKCSDPVKGGFVDCLRNGFVDRFSHGFRFAEEAFSQKYVSPVDYTTNFFKDIFEFKVNFYPALKKQYNDEKYSELDYEKFQNMCKYPTTDGKPNDMFLSRSNLRLGGYNALADWGCCINNIINNTNSDELKKCYRELDVYSFVRPCQVGYGDMMDDNLHWNHVYYYDDVVYLNHIKLLRATGSFRDGFYLGGSSILFRTLITGIPISSDNSKYLEALKREAKAEGIIFSDEEFENDPYKAIYGVEDNWDTSSLRDTCDLYGKGTNLKYCFKNYVEEFDIVNNLLNNALDKNNSEDIHNTLYYIALITGFLSTYHIQGDVPGYELPKYEELSDEEMTFIWNIIYSHMKLVYQDIKDFNDKEQYVEYFNQTVPTLTNSTDDAFVPLLMLDTNKPLYIRYDRLAKEKKRESKHDESDFEFFYAGVFL